MTTRSAETRFERARYEATLHVARILRRTYATRRSREQLTDIRGRVMFAKRNLLGAGLMRLGGNLLQRIEGTGAEFLDDPAWFAREAELARALHREPTAVGSDDTLLAPRLPGVDLATILREAHRPLEVRLRAIEQSARALLTLHNAGFSHADATAENVLIDGDLAHWIDFETQHRAGVGLQLARADDLRTLLFSSVWAADGLARECALRAFTAYPDREVWCALIGLREATSKSLVRVAQAPMCWPLYAATWAATLELT